MGQKLLGLAFALLLVVLVVIFSWLYSSTKRRLTASFLRNQEDALKAEVAAPLSTLIARGNTLAASFINRNEIQELTRLSVLGSDSEARQDGDKAPDVDALLADLRLNDFVLSLQVLNHEGLIVAEFQRHGLRPQNAFGQLLPKIHERTINKARRLGRGLMFYELVSVNGRAQLKVLAPLPSPGRQVGALIFRLDADKVLGRLSAGATTEPEARQGNVVGPVTLSDAQGRVLFPFESRTDGALLTFIGSVLKPRRQSRASFSVQRQGTMVSVASVTIPDQEDWRVLAMPLEHVAAPRLGAELALPIGLLASGLLLLIGLIYQVSRIQVRESATREKATYLSRSLAEKERSERFLDSVFNAITDVIVVQDTDYNIIRTNKVAREVYGDQLIGQKCYKIYRNKNEMNCKNCPVDATIMSGKPHTMEMVHPKTGEVWQINNFPLLDEQNQVQMVIEHARNITERRKLEENLIQTKKLSTLGEMAAGIAHEINNPVGVISMFAQLAYEDLDGQSELGDLKDKIQVIEDNAERIGKIVKDTLQFARKSEGERKMVEVKKIIDGALSIVELKKMDKAVDIQRDSGAGIHIWADEGQISQVVLNLVVNAIHAIEGHKSADDEQGQVEIRVQATDSNPAPPTGIPAAVSDEQSHGPRVRISVQDSGPGIKREDVKKIFDPFYTTKEQGQGTGLGLSVSFGIVRDHGGMIFVDSVANKGALFTLDFPSASERVGGRSQRLRKIEL